jgi:PKD repeat protein
VQIVADAVATAAVGIPYRYNSGGQVGVTSVSGAVRFSECGTEPPGFRVEPNSGTVTWVPLAAGTAMICVSVSDECSSATETFAVDVAAAPGPPPSAMMTVAPAAPQAGALVTFDASGSMAGAGASLVAFEWLFGDGSTGSDVKTTHTYPTSGGYTARLVVYDGAGQKAEATQGVPVGDSACPSPPLVRIEADHLTGDNSLTVAFGCSCSTPVTELWSFGDGASVNATDPTHTYAPGRFHVRLFGIDANGCAGQDAAEVIVNQPPYAPPLCDARVSPPAGPAPLVASFVSAYAEPLADQHIASATWSFDDGRVSSDAVVSRTLETPTTSHARLVVVSSTGLTCEDEVDAVALSSNGEVPPQVLSVPSTTAQCGQPYHYATQTADRVLVRGSRPLSYEVGKHISNRVIGAPPGFAVAADGTVSWSPTGPAGTQRVSLIVRNSAGTALQDFEVMVDCPTMPTGKGCGCGEASGVLAVLALFTLRKRRGARAA